VERIALERTSRFDMRAIGRPGRFYPNSKHHNLHAHGSSLFIAIVAACFPPHPKSSGMHTTAALRLKIAVRWPTEWQSAEFVA